MNSRRTFLGTVGASVASTVLSAPPAAKAPRRKLAIITTEWRYRSHAWHMGERFLGGYPLKGRWYRPAIDVVSAYVDQFPKNDLSKPRAKESRFTIYPSIARALRCGGDKLAVDAVLIIGEHGTYPNNDIGQKKYPRYEFFKQVVDVFRADGRSVPVFNDKHLSWRWNWAKEMVATAKKLKFPFLAGSSLPVTWRMPAIDLPWGVEVEEVMCVAMGGVDSYDFHALEVIQCMAERRKGGETGVVSLQALRGKPVWDLMTSGSFKGGGWDPRLFEACLCRSQTLAQAPTYSQRYPTTKQIRQWVKVPVAYRFEYADGLKATMLLLNGLVGDFTFAARLKKQAEPLSTLFYLPPAPNIVYSAALMSRAEEMFRTGKAPYPIERTLLTTGLVAAGMQSLAAGQKKLRTPHLAVKYKVGRASTFWQD
jgi:hypothetical protein